MTFDLRWAIAVAAIAALFTLLTIPYAPLWVSFIGLFVAVSLFAVWGFYDR
jgi:hypothetical protein